ncbi:DUF6069 family protein [Truepera radiovictrix]|uniref:Uncharacterized protein n=1 Tax=Truepera radiovictrix (strain DSM 17093 / CIP 108686 / LMG 22925 / RQ-24) TaxID=649638 RepID=D7CYD4_TRURR|nr:DUF6069 family protein [Truepera radiovictrix]ADI14773.1 conserved hypothetical protein [Truepera radiovictrix DSM 17093]WMT56676.1 DUF6069 family protein [Truepera radiovictrix]
MYATARPKRRRLLRDTLVAAPLGAAANALLFYASAAFGAFPQSVLVPRANAPFSVVPVIVFTLIGVLGAALMFCLVLWATPRPKRVFWTVAALVFTLMFFTPFSIPGAPVGMIVVLELMHVVAAAAALWPVARA